MTERGGKGVERDDVRVARQAVGVIAALTALALVAAGAFCLWLYSSNWEFGSYDRLGVELLIAAAVVAAGAVAVYPWRARR
jgi:hypothetical protein